MTPDFKNRKAIHYVLLSSIILLQLLLGLIIYNEIFNEAKLKEAETQVHISEQAAYFNELTKEDYNTAQNSLQYYIQTKDSNYLLSYNQALSRLNDNIQNLVATAGTSDLFALHLNAVNRSGLSIKSIKTILDSLRTIEIQPDSALKKELLHLTEIKYKDVLDSVHVETSVSVDSIERKNLLSRLGNAISGKMDVQKEKSNTILTLTHGKSSKSGNIDEQLDFILKKTNAYYQKEFLNYKKRLATLHNQDSDFLTKNRELLNYSNLLLKKYNDALISFTQDARHKFQQQYAANRLIRNYAVIGLFFLVIIISVMLVLLTRLAFQYEKRLWNAKVKIQQSLNFKNRIVGMISHEIRSPLNIIAILSKALVKQAKDEEIKDSLKSIEFTSNSLARLANQILDFSKNEHKKLELHNVPFDLKKELNEIMITIKNLVENNGNRLYVENEVVDSIMVNSDTLKIQQLFYNMIGNANKFTEKGTIHIKLLTKEIEKNTIKLFVEIKDDGIGINEEDLKYIFEGYYQGKTLGNIKNLGVGLGLNLCKEIIDLFNGEIAISSKKDVETILSFNLSLSKVYVQNSTI